MPIDQEYEGGEPDHSQSNVLFLPGQSVAPEIRKETTSSHSASSHRSDSNKAMYIRIPTATNNVLLKRKSRHFSGK